MQFIPAKCAFALGLLLLFPALTKVLPAQQASASLSGTVLSTAGQPVAGAHVIVKNVVTGQTANYTHVALQRVAVGDQVRITGVVPSTCSDFKIDRPTFLTVPIKNEIPVRVDLTWHSQ